MTFLIRILVSTVHLPGHPPAPNPQATQMSPLEG